MKRKFYAVVGQNGLAVMSDYARAINLQEYVRKSRIKGFWSFEEAQDWVLWEFAPNVPVGHYIPTPLVVNHALFRKHLHPIV